MVAHSNLLFTNNDVNYHSSVSEYAVTAIHMHVEITVIHYAISIKKTLYKMNFFSK